MTNFDDLPIVLNVNHIKDVLGISRASAYNLFHAEGFPSINIGKRVLVTKDAFKIWLKEQEKDNS